MKRSSIRIRSRLRSSGAAFIVVGFLVQLAAWNTGNNLLYIIAGGIASFLIVSFILTRWTLREIDIQRTGPGSIHRGDPFGSTVRLVNRKRRFPAASLRVENDAQVEGGFAYVPVAPPGETITLRMRHLFERRGVQSLEPVIVSTAFPLGLFRSRLEYRDAAEVVVYPRIRTLRPGVLEQMQGTGQTPRLMKGEGDEFFSLRDYIPGDDMRRIAWRVSARVRRLLVRELEPNTSRQVFLVFDARGLPYLPDFEEQFETAIEIVASLAMTFLDRYYEVAVITPDKSVSLNEGTAQATKILDMLARLNPAYFKEHSENWFASLDQTRSGAYVFISPDPGYWGRQSGFRSNRVLDPREVVRA